MTFKRLNPTAVNLLVTLSLVGLVSLFFVGAAYAALGFMMLLGFGAIVALVIISITFRQRK